VWGAGADTAHQDGKNRRPKELGHSNSAGRGPCLKRWTIQCLQSQIYHK
jgi:hypothetical protein